MISYLRILLIISLLMVGSSKSTTTTEEEGDDEEEESSTHPEVVTDPDGDIVMRKEDLEFLKGVYHGVQKATYKKVLDTIYRALNKNYKQISEQVKDNQLLKAYVKTANNITDGVNKAFEVVKDRDLSDFLANWYKTEHKPQKGEIKEVEVAIKQHEQEVTAPTTAPPPTVPTGKKQKAQFAKEVHKQAKKAGLKDYGKKHLIKDLADEQRKAKAG